MMVMEGGELMAGPGHKGRRPAGPRPGWEEGSGLVNWQKEILWMVVTEGIVDRESLVDALEEAGAEDVEIAVEGMVANGFLEDINGYLRVHPDFAHNCYALIR